MTLHTVDTGTDQLLCTLADGVATITLNRPDKRNALSDELTPALRQTLLVVEADPDVRRVVITTGYANIGLSGEDGGTWLLTQLVGVARAKSLYFTGRRVGADKGLALGLFDEVVADDDLQARAQAMAAGIAAGPPIALRYMKEHLNRALQVDLRSALALEADRLVRCARTEDHQEAVQAFLHKRKPSFTGR
jgi:enoyl-CoA hydratase/carnithine racemase